MRILLVRHGQSKSNVDRSITKTKADHLVELSELGKMQATVAAHKIINFYRERARDTHNIKLWVSPYLRTRQTASIIDNAIIDELGFTLFKHKAEHVNLVEQQYGLLDGLEDAQIQIQFPKEHANYVKCGKFFASIPLGESKFDVAIRAGLFLQILEKDCIKNGITDVVIVSHGTAGRALIMQYMNYPYEWMMNEPIPKNCSIRLLEDDIDHGYIYDGILE